MDKLIPIGIIRTPFKKLAGMPIQPTGASGVKGKVEVFKKFRSGLKDIEGFSHIILLYIFHRSKGFDLEVVPFMDDKVRGVFSTRAPRRPNQIGLSVVQLNTIKNGILYIQNADILDGTPLLDIKPYVPDFDHRQNVRLGWLEKARKKVFLKKADNRFIESTKQP